MVQADCVIQPFDCALGSGKQMAKKTQAGVRAIEVRQWLSEWNKIKFDPAAFQSRPPESFLMLSLRASTLKALTGVYRRSTRAGQPRALDQNIQRGHEEERSTVIRQYVQYGYPWCEMSDAKRQAAGAGSLRKPGWLPTSILINILPQGASRNGIKLAEKDRVKIVMNEQGSQLILPEGAAEKDWSPESIYPLEVIDGQHRLWAFEGFDPGDDFELPVVAFSGLDRSWQAYLFWSVNITPKKINRSLAFDLYPLLRQEDWLDRFTGHSIYRETRAQELVEALWGNSSSPWFKRINMLGETSKQRLSSVPMVTQAAWIRSLMASFIKQWEGTGTRIGGLFGAPVNQDRTTLPWSRPMQAAFLIVAGREFQKAVAASRSTWAKSLRAKGAGDLFEDDSDPAFYGSNSLIATDQGVRGFLSVVNDLCFVMSDDLDLPEWSWEAVNGTARKASKQSAIEEQQVGLAISSLQGTEIEGFLVTVSAGLATYDWRTSSTPGLTNEERLRQAVFRGSSGYKELRRSLVLHLAQARGDVGQAAKRVADVLAYA